MDVVATALADLAEQMRALRVEAAARDAATRAEVAAVRAELAAHREGKAVDSPSALSYASVGADALAALAAIGRISDAAAPPEGAGAAESAPFATPDDLARLRACTSEPDFVAAITPLLRAARGLDEAGAAADPFARVLVNSERVPWLDALHAQVPAGQLKRPDFFATWAPFWSGCTHATRGAVGRLAARALQLDGCAREFYEAKDGAGQLTPTDFGQLVDYHSRVRGRARGVLFNARFFWLYESERGHPIALIKNEWGARGSRAALRAFFDAVPEPPLVPLLRHLCRKLGVAPRRVTEEGIEPAAADGATRTSAFLGAGGSARVFCVAAEGAEALALKASTTLSRAELDYEFTMLARAAAAGAPVVPAVPDSLVFFVDAEGAYRGGGFLLRDVCTRAAADSRARVAAAFDALRALHAAGIVHGDARLPNLLVCGHGAGAGLRWIDLREAAAADALAVAQRADARALAASVIGAAQGGALPARVDAALGGVPDGGEEGYAALAAAVWGAKTAP